MDDIHGNQFSTFDKKKPQIASTRLAATNHIDWILSKISHTNVPKQHVTITKEKEIYINTVSFMYSRKWLLLPILVALAWYLMSRYQPHRQPKPAYPRHVSDVTWVAIIIAIYDVCDISPLSLS